MLVSIIIPVLNGETRIKKCLESIINQDYKNVEIIVVDNGSQDSTINIVNDLQKKDTRIKQYLCKEKGVSNARNFGIQKASGDYIMFVDADDTIDKDMVTLMLKNAMDKKCDIVKCSFKIIQNEREENFCLKEGIYTINKKFWQKFFSTYNYNQVWGQLINSKICKQIKFDSNLFMAEDYLFNYYLYKKQKEIYVMESPLYNYYYNELGMNYNKEINKVKKKIEDILCVCKELSKVEPNYRIVINNRFIYEIIPHIRDAFLNKQFNIKQLDFLLNEKFYTNALKDISIKYNFKKYFLALLLKWKKYRTLKIFFKLSYMVKGWKKK